MPKPKKPEWFGRPGTEVVVMVLIGAAVILVIALVAEWFLAGKGLLGQGKPEVPDVVPE